MNYRDFMKVNIKSPHLAHLKQTERMREVARMWRESGHSSSKAHKSAKGKGIFEDIGTAADSVGHLFGLGLVPQSQVHHHRKHRNHKTHGGAVVGGDILSDVGSFFGLGLKPKRGRRKAHGGQIVGGGLGDVLKTMKLLGIK